MLSEKANDFKHNSNKLNYIAANKSGKHLTSIIQKVLKRQPVVIKDKTLNKIHTNNQTINDEFRQFYEKLYTSEMSDQDPLPFLASTKLRQLSPEQIETLNKDISSIEILSAIKDFPKKKAPGMDGYPIEFYTTFWAKIDLLFTEVVNSLQKSNSLPETMYQASISVIPKPGKICEEPSHYRPISLLNCDKKIITKILNNRLLGNLPSLIHYDQAGFIQHGDLRTNTRTCFSLIQYAKKHKIDLTLLAVDAEKAFDRLEWPYLFKVLEAFPFPEKFVNMIKTLYKSPRAYVYTNGILSKPFPLSRGTAQGCPLSPSLFALAIEPLAQKIRDKKEITGVEIGMNHFKLSLFADDLLLYLRNVDTSIPHLMEVISDFSRISGYKMNISKTELMVIEPGNMNMENLKQFQIKKKSIKYLGCYISSDKSQLFKDNFLPIVKEFRNDVKQWHDLRINLIGRINIIKTMWLPKFLFKFQTIPIIPPKSFFKEVNSIISSFIWSNKACRLKRKLLQYPRTEGCLNLPNLELYYTATQLFYIDRIINNTNEDPWIYIENSQLEGKFTVSPLF